MATVRQKLAASKMVENGGNMGQAMLAAGYSEAMAKNPYKLTQSKGWQEMVNEIIPDYLVLQKLAENMYAESITASNQAIHIILKIKGKYAPEKLSFSDPYDDMSDEELNRRLAEIKREKRRNIKLMEDARKNKTKL